jgi:small subunit ribosomal protein S20
LANTKQAKKRASQAEKRRAHNHARMSEMRTYKKRVLKAVQAGNQELAATEYKLASSIIDRVAGKGLIHRNTASRYKSRLSKKIKKLAAA